MIRRALVCGLVMLGTLPALGQWGGGGRQRPGPGGDPWSYGNNGPGRWDNSWNNRPDPRAGACFYTGGGFGGNHFCVRKGDRLTSLPGDFGDNISSIRVFGRGSVRVFDDRNFQGVSQSFRGSIPDLQRVRSKPGHTWNNRISSIAVQ